MDADKSSAARKLPQTAANYFVGTNSRVPRMTLAQSSVTIPIPAPKSPGTGASPGVAPGRLKTMPLPKSPTFNKTVASPRSATSEGGKVARAVQLFSTLPGQHGDDAASHNAVNLPSFFLVPQDKEVWEKPATKRQQSLLNIEGHQQDEDDINGQHVTLQRIEQPRPALPDTADPQANPELTLPLKQEAASEADRAEGVFPVRSMSRASSNSAAENLVSHSEPQRSVEESFPSTPSPVAASGNQGSILPKVTQHEDTRGLLDDFLHQLVSVTDVSRSPSSTVPVAPFVATDAHPTRITTPKAVSELTKDFVVRDEPRLLLQSTEPRPSFPLKIDGERLTLSQDDAKLQNEHPPLEPPTALDSQMECRSKAMTNAPSPVPLPRLSLQLSSLSLAHALGSASANEPASAFSDASTSKAIPVSTEDTHVSSNITADTEPEPADEIFQQHFDSTSLAPTEIVHLTPAGAEHRESDFCALSTVPFRREDDVPEDILANAASDRSIQAESEPQSQPKSSTAQQLPGKEGYELHGESLHGRVQHPSHRGNADGNVDEETDGDDGLAWLSEQPDRTKLSDQSLLQLDSHSHHSSEPIESLIFDYATGEDEVHGGRHDMLNSSEDGHRIPARTTDMEAAEEPVDPFSILDADSPNHRDSFIERTTSWIRNTIQEGANIPMESDSHEIKEAKDVSVEIVAQAESVVGQIVDDELLSGVGAGQVSLGDSEELTLTQSPLRVTALLAHEPTSRSSDQGVISDVTNRGDQRSYIEKPSLDLVAPRHDTEEVRTNKLTRSYSQRSKNGEPAAKVVSKIPGRLVITEREDQIAVHNSRASIEVLPVDAVVTAGASLQAIVSQQGNGRPACDVRKRSNNPVGIGKPAPDEGRDHLRSASLEQDGNQHTKSMKDSDGLIDSSEDEEADSVVAVCKRVSLKRSSVRSTPKRASRPLRARRSHESLQQSCKLAMQPNMRQLPGKLAGRNEASDLEHRQPRPLPDRPSTFIQAAGTQQMDEKTPGKLRVPRFGSAGDEPKLESLPGKLVQQQNQVGAQAVARPSAGKLSIPIFGESSKQHEARVAPGKLQINTISPGSKHSEEGTSPGKLPFRAFKESEWTTADKPLPGKLQNHAFCVSPQHLQGRATPGKLSEQSFMPKSWVPQDRPLPGKLSVFAVKSENEAPDMPLPPRRKLSQLSLMGEAQAQKSRLPWLEQAPAKSEMLQPRVDSVKMDEASGDESDIIDEPLDEFYGSTLQEYSDSDSRSCGVGDSVAPAIVSKQSTKDTDVAEIQEILDLGDETVDKENQAPTESPTAARRIRSRTLRPLRLPGSRSGTSTPQKPAVSVTDSTPYTARSELWSPNASAPAQSTLTDETSVSRPQSISGKGMRGRSGTILIPRPSDSDGASQRQSQLPSNGDQWLHRQGSESPHHSPSHAYHKQPKASRGVHKGKTASVGAAELPYNQRQALDFSAVQYTPQIYAPPPPAPLNPAPPSFEISFQLTEPKTLPECSNGTLLEFGLRVCIKPNATPSRHSSDPGFQIRPSVGLGIAAAPTINSPQYEYSRLSTSDMAQVQQSAQEHLRQSYTSPCKGKTSSQKLRPSPLDLEALGRGRSHSALQVMRELQLPRSRQVSVSQSTIISTALSSARYGGERTSSLPYIKRATPRSVSSAGRSQS